MVARVLPSDGTLEVVLYRPGEPPVRLSAETGERALIRGLQLLLRADALRAGDTLVVVPPGGDVEPEPDLPQVSRASTTRNAPLAAAALLNPPRRRRRPPGAKSPLGAGRAPSFPPKSFRCDRRPSLRVRRR